jgi:polyferredoxin
MAGYSAVLVVLLSVFAYMLFTRTEVDVTLLRTPGLLYQLQPDGKISNLFDLKITNKTFKPLPVTVELKNMKGEIKMVGDNLTAPAQQITGTKFLLVLRENDIKGTLTPVTLVVKAAGNQVYEVNSSFLGRVEDENKDEKEDDE